MQDFQNYWHTIFYADPEKSPDYQLRWALYKKWATFSVGPNDMLLIPNALLKSSDEINKTELAGIVEKEGSVLNIV